MKRMEKGIDKLIIILGLLVIQKIAIYLAVMERGYFAIGGEYLVIPLILGIRYLYKEAKRNIRLYR